jgi:hypothetical protein
MRATRFVATFAALVPFALQAQISVQKDVRQDAAPQESGALVAKLHYTDASDVAFSTNKPAYVAIFDLSRSYVSQLYPTFSAEAAQRAGTYRRIDLSHLTSYVAPSVGSSSLVPLNASFGAGRAGLTHTIVLVASTAPLEVGNPYASNIALNSRLFGEQHWTDLQTAPGINALVALVRPLAANAELAIDQIEVLPQTPRVLAALAYNPSIVTLGYSCFDGRRTFFVPVPTSAAICTAVRTVPAAALNPGAPRRTGSKADSAVRARRAASSRTNAATSSTTNISDPAEIRRFLDDLKNGEGSSGEPAVMSPRESQRTEQTPTVNNTARPMQVTRFTGSTPPNTTTPSRPAVAPHVSNAPTLAPNGSSGSKPATPAPSSASPVPGKP